MRDLGPFYALSRASFGRFQATVNDLKLSAKARDRETRQKQEKIFSIVLIKTMRCPITEPFGITEEEDWFVYEVFFGFPSTIHVEGSSHQRISLLQHLWCVVHPGDPRIDGCVEEECA